MKTYNGTIEMMHPTQCAVGYAEVAVKMRELEKCYKEGTLEKHLKEKVIPGVLGPDNIFYIIDHHHLGLALTILAFEWKEDNPEKSKDLNPYRKCVFEVVNDFSISKLNKKNFFQILESLKMTHPYDENGIKSEKIPKRLIDLKNDPYRSLAGFVRKTGGFKKVKTPYIEFVWADFFRKHIKIEEINENMSEAVIKAVSIALSERAKDLPGWTGVEIVKELNTSLIDRMNKTSNKIRKTEILEEKIKDAQNTTQIDKAIKFKS